LLGRYSRQLRKSCAGASTVYSQAQSLFILEHYFASKSSAAVCEAPTNDNEVLTGDTISEYMKCLCAFDKAGTGGCKIAKFFLKSKGQETARLYSYTDVTELKNTVVVRVAF
jgi:hypothetical protein